jgi:hypothetical protein
MVRPFVQTSHHVVYGDVLNFENIADIWNESGDIN